MDVDEAVDTEWHHQADYMTAIGATFRRNKRNRPRRARSSAGKIEMAEELYEEFCFNETEVPPLNRGRRLSAATIVLVTLED